MSGPSAKRTGLCSIAAVVLCATVLGIALQAGTARDAVAQGWWPWSGGGDQPPPVQRPPPVPREPVYRGGPGQPPPPSAPGPGPGANPNQSPGPGGFAQPGAGAQANKAPICVQLEQRLVLDAQRGNASRDTLPKLEAELRQVDRSHQTALAQLERAECYDYFLFSKTLRRTPNCVALATQVESSKRRVAELDTQRQQILGSRERSFEDDIIRDLARNNCGARYTQEAQRRGSGPFSSLWQDEDTGPSRGSDFGALPFATYRTVCVRLCDGYFFPVSFSTLTNHFERDMDMCQSQCAAPAELFYHQNPGGTMEQAVSARSNSPYMSLKTAFKYRKEYVQGCSCKQAEYTPSPADRGDRRTDAPAGGSPPARQAHR